MLADDVTVDFSNDTLSQALVWLSVDGREVCIDVMNCKVRVGDYVPFELAYNRNDDVIGLYDELSTGNYS